MTENTCPAKCSRRCLRVAEEPHSCPFRSDINGDDETMCECCVECQGECADDI